MVADQVDLSLGDAGLLAGGFARLTVQLSQQKVDAAEVRRTGGLTAGKAEDLVPDFLREGYEGKA